MRGLAAFLSLLLSAGSAHAYLKAGPIGYGHWLKAATVQDGMATSLAAAYSFRLVRSAYLGTGAAVRLRRASDNAESDIGFSGSNDLDTTAAVAFCAATTCYVKTVYDQSGGNRHFVQAAAADQPLYVADCTGGHPCMRLDATDYMQSSVSASATTGVMTIAGVAKRTAGLGGAGVLNPAGGSSLSFYPSAGFMAVYPGPGLTATAAENIWHSAIGVINGASSNLNVDGNQFPGTQATTPTSGLPVMGSAAGTTFEWAEAFAWNNYALTAAEQTALIQNQKDYWLPLPLDSFATPAAAYSMRRLKSTYSGPGIRLRRASDNAETDINFLSFTSFTGAPLDTAAANAHCAATTCTIATWYDQSGNNRPAVRAAAQQPNFVFNCNGTLPCIRTTTSNEILGTDVPHVAPVMPTTFSAVANRSAGTGACYIPIQFTANNAMYTNTAAGQWGLGGGVGGTILATAADATWHSGIGVLAGASSVLRIDATETTGTATGATTAEAFLPIYGGAGATCNLTEVIVWSGYALTAGERAALQANQKSFWGTP